MNQKYLVNREISWLSFNQRVLQEAEDKSVPLVQRMRFLGIFSNNLDEFFKVRVAAVRRIVKLGKKSRGNFVGEPEEVMEEINRIALTQQNRFQKVYNELLKDFKKEGVYILDEHEMTEEQGRFVQSYFQDNVRQVLVPIMLNHVPQFPHLKDNTIHLAIRMDQKGTVEPEFALIEIPTVLSRFLVLPGEGRKKYIILLDDVIRYCLKDIFALFPFDNFKAYTFKITRDAELDLDNDVSKSFLEKMTSGLEQRKTGDPVRFVYDDAMPVDLHQFLLREMQLSKESSIPGGRYHNFKDFIKFPNVGKRSLVYRDVPPIPHPDMPKYDSILSVIAKKDVLLHYPYHPFNHFIDLLTEAAIDPKVKAIKISLYRVAKMSKVGYALINASKNGKKVTVVIELQARFDEANNIRWSERFKEAGIEVIFGVPGLKVHCKALLIQREENDIIQNYAGVGTGNFNEDTADLYGDHMLLTTDDRIANEIQKLFDFFEINYRDHDFEHLMVSPFSNRQGFEVLIEREIHNAKKGRDAWIIAKVNSLVDEEMIDLLYSASNAGVKIDLIVRGNCSVRPGIKGLSENIRIVSIIDKYLEHSRLFAFCNNGKEKYYLSSADWMTRNLDFRVEVTAPIYDRTIQKEIRKMLDMQLEDDVKARIVDKDLQNEYKKSSKGRKIRFQVDYPRYLKRKYQALARKK